MQRWYAKCSTLVSRLYYVLVSRDTRKAKRHGGRPSFRYINIARMAQLIEWNNSVEIQTPAMYNSTTQVIICEINLDTSVKCFAYHLVMPEWYCVYIKSPRVMLCVPQVWPWGHYVSPRTTFTPSAWLAIICKTHGSVTNIWIQSNRVKFQL